MLRLRFTVIKTDQIFHKIDKNTLKVLILRFLCNSVELIEFIKK